MERILEISYCDSCWNFDNMDLRCSLTGTVLTGGFEIPDNCPLETKQTLRYSDALNLRFSSDAGEDITIREYLHKLLLTLWKERSEFSGKRPFGNSDWEYDIFIPLIKDGLISGEVDEDGYLVTVDDEEAHGYVTDLINAIFNGE